MKNILLLLICLIIISCSGDKTVVIKKYITEPVGEVKLAPESMKMKSCVIEEKLLLSTQQLILSMPLHSFLMVEGVEQLSVKRLLLGNGLTDFSFIQNIPSIEVLILEYGLECSDLGFIKYLPNLKILFADMGIMSSTKLDLKENKKLEFIGLHGFNVNPPDSYFELEIKNVPNSLNCIDVRYSLFVIINEKFLENLKNVEKIYILKTEEFDNIRVNIEKLKKYKNVIIVNDFNEEVLPKEYRRENIYSLFGSTWNRTNRKKKLCP